MPLNRFREIQRLSKARSARAEFLSSHSNYPEKEFIRKNSGILFAGTGLALKATKIFSWVRGGRYGFAGLSRRAAFPERQGSD